MNIQNRNRPTDTYVQKGLWTYTQSLGLMDRFFNEKRVQCDSHTCSFPGAASLTQQPCLSLRLSGKWWAWVTTFTKSNLICILLFYYSSSLKLPVPEHFEWDTHSNIYFQTFLAMRMQFCFPKPSSLVNYKNYRTSKRTKINTQNFLRKSYRTSLITQQILLTPWEQCMIQTHLYNHITWYLRNTHNHYKMQQAAYHS